MFWGDTTLKGRLSGLIYPYDPNRIECASYRLSVGKEVYVSPDWNVGRPDKQDNNLASS